MEFGCLCGNSCFRLNDLRLFLLFFGPKQVLSTLHTFHATLLTFKTVQASRCSRDIKLRPSDKISLLSSYFLKTETVTFDKLEEYKK